MELTEIIKKLNKVLLNYLVNKDSEIKILKDEVLSSADCEQWEMFLLYKNNVRDGIVLTIAKVTSEDIFLIKNINILNEEYYLNGNSVEIDLFKSLIAYILDILIKENSKSLENFVENRITELRSLS